MHILQGLALLAFIGYFYFSYKETKEYFANRPVPTFNVILTLNPKHYTDIKWYETFRDFSRWETCGEYAFKGKLKEEELIAFSQTLENDLGISSKDYQIDFYNNSGSTANYILSFKEIERPDIEEFPHLEILGFWAENGENGYRLTSSVSAERIRENIKNELELADEAFHLFNVASFAWTRFI